MGTSRISNPPCSWPVPTCQRVEGLITAKAVSCPPFWHSYLSLSMVLNHIISYHIISYHIILYHIISYHIISYQVSYIMSSNSVLLCTECIASILCTVSIYELTIINSPLDELAFRGQWFCGPVSSGSRMAGRPNIDPQI